jgi:hypothetical protein
MRTLAGAALTGGAESDTTAKAGSAVGAYEPEVAFVQKAGPEAGGGTRSTGPDMKVLPAKRLFSVIPGIARCAGAWLAVTGTLAEGGPAGYLRRHPSSNGNGLRQLIPE